MMADADAVNDLQRFGNDVVRPPSVVSPSASLDGLEEEKAKLGETKSNIYVLSLCP